MIARRVLGDIREQPRVVDVLLREGVGEVVVRQAGDGEHRRAVELGVVEAGQQVQAAGAGGREAAAEPAGPLRVARRP